MGYVLKILPIAQKDSHEARKWYEKKRTGLGKEFKQEVNAEIEYLGQNPHHFQRHYRALRLSLIKRFSYDIFYLIDEERKMAIILHTRRNTHDRG